MPRLSLDDWESARAEREAGASFETVAKKFGVSKGAVVKRAHKEGWGDGTDVKDAILRKVTEKVSGVVTPAVTPKRSSKPFPGDAR